MSLSHSAQWLSGNTWNTFLSFGLSYKKKLCTGLKGSRKEPQRWSRDWEAGHTRKGRENWVYSALRKEDLGKTLPPVFKGWLERRWRLTFYKESCGKDEDNEYISPEEMLIGCKRNIFYTENNQPLESLQGSGKFPNVGHLKFVWTGCWNALSGPCFCQKRFDQVVLQVHFQPAILWFYVPLV